MESESSIKSGKCGSAASVKPVEAEFEMSLLASTLAHEIRNPLQAIRLQIDVASRGGAVPEALKNISENITRLEAVVARVQQLGHKYVLNPETVNLRTLVENALSSVHFWLSASGILVRTHSQWEGEPLCFADPELLQQVLLNLFMNSIQAMPKGGTLSIYLAEEIDYAVVEITDTGEGFPAEALSMLGTPFFTTKSDGTGLGLAFCKTIAALHEGSMEFDNVSPRGARVTMRLSKSLNRKDDSHVQ